VSTPGEIIDGLGCTLEELPDSSLPAGAIVLIKYVDDAGDVGLLLSFSDGLSWLERVGMLAYANAIEQWPEAD
jgi:hypothetical protein